MDLLIILLRIVHIFAGVLWVGAAWLGVFFLEPAVRALGPDGGKFMTYISTARRYPVVISVAAILTLVAGWSLFVILRWDLIGAKGLVFAAGGVLALVAGAIGGGIVGPTSTKMARLGTEIAGAGKPPTREQGAEIAALQARLHTSGLWNAVFASLALLAMAIARWFPG
jgi:hypothetical protein